MIKKINMTIISVLFLSFCAHAALANGNAAEEAQKKQMIELCEKKKEELRKNNADPEYQKQLATICNATTIAEGDPQNMAILSMVLIPTSKNQSSNNPDGKQ